MAIAYVRGSAYTSKVSANANYVQSFAITPTVATTAGNFLLLAIGVSNGAANSVGSVTDTQGNTWTKAASAITGAGYSSADIWYTTASASNIPTITINSAGGNYYGYAVNLREYSGVAGGIDVVGTTTDGSNYTQNHTGTVTTTQANDMVVVFTSQNTNSTETFTATVPLGNLVQQGDGLYTTMASADALQGAVGVGNYVLNTAGYDNGVTFAVALAPTAVVIPTPPGSTNTPGWYPYGALPTGKTVAQLKTITQNWWTNHFKPYIITTGMPSGMPSGAMRVYRPENSNDTVSEGMGYGLVAAVLMADYDPQAQTIFDGLLKYVKFFYNSNGLMKWHIDSSGNPLDGGSATDGDVDIAWGLHLAVQKWGTSGTTFNYATERDNSLAAILAYDFYSATNSNTALRNVQINGDGWDAGQTGSPDKYDPDYTAPMYYSAWATFNSRWADIKNTNWNVVKQVDRFNTGLLPDRMTRSGNAASGENFNSGYNAVRRFRQVADYLNYGSTQPTPYPDYYLEKHLADFIATKSANTPANMKAEWTLDGSSSGTYINSLFASSYMVAMLVDPTNAQLAADTIDWIVAHPDGSYFGDTVTFMNLATAAGYMTPTTTAYAGKSLATDYINFTFSSPATTYTKSHGISSVKRKAVAVSHSTDSVKRKQSTVSHSTSANKRTVFTKSHTTDALKRVANLTRSHSTSSVLRKGFTRSHTTDALKLARTTRQHSTDALKRVSGLTRSHTTDALKRAQVTRSHATDSLKRKAFTASHSTSSVLRRAIIRSHSTDALKRVSGLLRTHSTDAFKKNRFSRSHTTDAQLFVRTFSQLSDNFDDNTVDTSKWSGNYSESGGQAFVFNDGSSNTYIRTAQTRSLVGNSFFFKYGAYTQPFGSHEFLLLDSSGTMIYRLSHDEDNNLRLTNGSYANLATFAYTNGYDWIRFREAGGTLYIDVATSPSATWVNKYTGTAQYPLNNIYFQADEGYSGSGGGKGGAGGYIDNFNISAAQFTRPQSTDSIKRRATAISHSTDAVKRTTTTKSHSTDALKRVANITRSHSTSSNLRKSGLVRSHSTDTLKRGNYVRFHTTDAQKRVAGLTRSHTTDSLKRQQFFKTHSTDALKRAQLTRTHTTSAVVRKALTRLHSTDANKRLAITRQHSTDANKRVSGFTRVHSTDALKRAALNRSHSTDALKRVAGLTRSHSTSAVIRKQFVRSHSTDSLVRRQIVLVHSTDALKRGGLARNHTTDANKRKVTVVSHSTDANKRRANITISHTTSANKRTANLLKSHSTDALKRTQNVRTHSTDTVKRQQFTRAHSTDSFKRIQTVKSHSTNALKRQNLTRSHTTNSIIRGANGQFHLADANKRSAYTVSHSTSANKRASNITRSHSTNSLLRKAFTVSHSTNALLRKAFNRLHTTDANKRKAFTRIHSTDANKRKSNLLRTHTTNSLLRKFNYLLHTTDTVLRATNSLSHSTDTSTHTLGQTAHSTDSIHRDYRYYTREQNPVLPTDANSRSIGFYKAEVVAVGQNDNANYVDQSGVKYLLFYFEQYTGNNRDQFYVTWNGKSTIATSTRPVYLQIFNQSTQLWETLDMNNNTAPNTEFTLTGQKTVGMQNYYDANIKLTARVYQ